MNYAIWRNQKVNRWLSYLTYPYWNLLLVQTQEELVYLLHLILLPNPSFLVQQKLNIKINYSVDLTDDAEYIISSFLAFFVPVNTFAWINDFWVYKVTENGLAIGALLKEIFYCKLCHWKATGQSLLLQIFKDRFQGLISSQLGVRSPKRGILKKSASQSAKQNIRAKWSKLKSKLHSGQERLTKSLTSLNAADIYFPCWSSPHLPQKP